MGTPEERYAALVDALVSTSDARQGSDIDPTRKGFGSSGQLRIGGKIFAMLVRGRLVVKLPRQRVDGLIAAGDTTTGTATCSWTANIGTQNSQSFTIGIVAGNYYTRNSPLDNTVVTVSRPLSNFITGGGYLLMSSSAGLKPGDPGTRNNFGFNVKYNKGMTNLQGSINTILRNGGHAYQIKGNSMTSLAVQPLPAGGRATFYGKASIQDVTVPASPVSIDGNATLQVTLTDIGEPGTGDTIGITLWTKTGDLWFTSNWSGTKTVEQTLAGGNLVVH